MLAVRARLRLRTKGRLNLIDRTRKLLIPVTIATIDVSIS